MCQGSKNKLSSLERFQGARAFRSRHVPGVGTGIFLEWGLRPTGPHAPGGRFYSVPNPLSFLRSVYNKAGG